MIGYLDGAHSYTRGSVFQDTYMLSPLVVLNSLFAGLLLDRCRGMPQMGALQ